MPSDCSTGSSRSGCSTRTRWSASGRRPPTPDDDIEVYGDETRGSVVARFHTLRQQMAKTNGRPDVALSDYTAPIGSGVADHIGLFAVTAGIGLEELRATVHGRQR